MILWIFGAIIVAGILLGIIGLQWDTHKGGETSAFPVLAGATFVVIGVIGLMVSGWMIWKPNYNLYKAEIEKRILVEEAKAEQDAAVYFAEEEITRATGVAEANRIIAESITDEYIRWLYVDNLADHNATEIIYIPTEGGLPILEATRLEETAP